MSAKLVFIEWDSQELRLVTAKPSGDVLQAWSVPLPAPEQLGEVLAREVEEHRLHRAEAVVAVSRRDVEVRELEIPPTPPEEQPDIVRFLAPKEFTQFDEGSAVDFYEIGRRDQMHRMLAALLDSGARKRILDCLHEAHLTPKQLALRPLSAVSLLDKDVPAPRLLVEAASEDADLSVHNGHQVVSIRNVRLPDGAARESALQAELKRTAAVARNQLGQSVSEVIVFGAEQDFPRLASDWSLDAPLRFVDPRHGVAPRLQLDHPGRFASLLGLSWLFRTGKQPAIDFLNPRERPKAQSKVTAALIASVGALLVALIVVLVVFLRLGALDNEIEDLVKRQARAKKAAGTADEIVAHRDTVQESLDANVIWLDELRRVSEHSLTYDDVTFTKWSARIRDTEPRGGTLALDGSATDPDVILQLEEQLRGDGRKVKGRGHNYDAKNSKHPYSFRQLTISISSPNELEDIAAEQAAAQREAGEQPDDGSPSDSSSPQTEAQS